MSLHIPCVFNNIKRLQLKNTQKLNPNWKIFNWCPSSPSRHFTYHPHEDLMSYQEWSQHSYRCCRNKILMSGIWTFSLISSSYSSKTLHLEVKNMLKTNLIPSWNLEEKRICFNILRLSLYMKSTLLQKFSMTKLALPTNMVILYNLENKDFIHTSFILNTYISEHVTIFRQTWTKNFVHSLKIPWTCGLIKSQYIHQWQHLLNLQNMFTTNLPKSCLS